MPRIVCLWLGLLLSFSGFGQSDKDFQIIPKPAKMESREGRFMFSNETTIRFPPGNADLKTMAENFIRQFQAATGFSLRTENRSGATPTGTFLAFVPVSYANLGDEGYRLDVTTTTITIEASKPAGFFYAIQSLYQLLPPEIFRSTPADSSVNWSIPACRIEDKPRYRYRGLHLDVARHFFPVSFIKKYIDLLALYKFNTFHWHLTDDQGWRIEIKKYPKLTQVGSRRKETLIGHYYESDPQQFDGQPYGGFYTQDEVREVVRYAKSKYVTIIPEIEMPGHALAILAAYPEFGCSGGPYETATKWGIFTDVLCPYDRTFTFLQDVLMEVMTLFPGPYIHIGGDECPKTSWKKSPFCQNLMKRLKLKNENQLQSYFISRIDKWVTSKGWKTIGWDEILEGNSPAIRVSPGATVMSWRGIDGGLKAARQNHDVIMTPGDFLYLDHYQADRSQEPLAFGRFTPLEKTYSYDPTPADLPATAQKHLIGAQANVWTEYLKTADQVEYMVWPRAAAVAEVVWTPLDQKNWPDFTRRLPVLFKRLEALGVSYSRAYYDVVAETRPQPDGSLQIALATQEETAEIRYSTDGSTPTDQSVRYDRPLNLTKPTTVKAVAVKNGIRIGDVQAWDFAVSKATGKSIQLDTAPTRPKNAEPSTLIDGRYGTTIGYLEEMQNVVGVKTADLTATLDLAEPKSIQLVTIGLVKATAGAILLPRQIAVAVSDDGRTFRTVKTVSMDPTERGKKAIIRQTLTFEPVMCRYVRIMARNVGKVPTGMPQAGKEAWVMADEITVE
ncbi:glycoside hydrolase family 20 protein [Larkinella humicola]|uniref:beta-N-acetylhexosaminidase n=1 Tax=Larkinella humicola TaxID=2607654 RepID=A0A5N1JJT2_9BACT|nr:glycoside hydrolase family 20 protein [Larkinella humicola]KAA9355050.1 family 20 glycosylhydrolase [Larkinella humicola]